MAGYEVRRVDELDAIPVDGAEIVWRPVRRALGIRSFGINAYTADAGERVIEEHTEESVGHEEVYVVLRGRALFTAGDEELELEPATLVYYRDAAVTRGAIALEDGTAVLAIGGKPGEVFAPSAWEWWFAAEPHYTRGDYEGALAVVEEGLAERPDSPGLHYAAATNLARLGCRDEALARLRTAVELGPQPREWAPTDDAFASLRDDPEFLAITGQSDAADGGS